MSRSLAARIARLERRLREMSERKDVQVVVRDFGRAEPSQERVEQPGSYRLFPCPGGCGTQVRTGEARCSGCGEGLAWISPTTGEAV